MSAGMSTSTYTKSTAARCSAITGHRVQRGDGVRRTAALRSSRVLVAGGQCRASNTHRPRRVRSAAAAHGLRTHHSAYGAYRLGDTEVINASLVDDDYRPGNAVVRLSL
jgi:hypothetical protein